MEIHAPEKPIHTWREFVIHIAVVTVGILIAIGLEGVREVIVTRHLLHETRDTLRDEASDAVEKIEKEFPSVQKGNAELQDLVLAMPGLAKTHPEQVVQTLDRVKNPNYFFTSNAWQAALSTGALAHMKPLEVSAYAWSAEATRNYSLWQQKTLDADMRANAFWRSHPHPTPEQIAEGDELLRYFATAQSTLAYLGPQTRADFQRAKRAAEAR